MRVRSGHTVWLVGRVSVTHGWDFPWEWIRVPARGCRGSVTARDAVPARRHRSAALWLRSYGVAVLASRTPADPSNACNLASPSGVYILYPGTSGHPAARRLARAGPRAGNRPGKGGKELPTSLQQACNMPATTFQLWTYSGVAVDLPAPSSVFSARVPWWFSQAAPARPRPTSTFASGCW